MLLIGFLPAAHLPDWLVLHSPLVKKICKRPWGSKRFPGPYFMGYQAYVITDGTGKACSGLSWAVFREPEGILSLL